MFNSYSLKSSQQDAQHCIGYEFLFDDDIKWNTVYNTRAHYILNQRTLCTLNEWRM